MASKKTARHIQFDNFRFVWETIIVNLFSRIPPLLIALATAGGRSVEVVNNSAMFNKERAYCCLGAPIVSTTIASQAISSVVLSWRRATHRTGFHHKAIPDNHSSQRT